MWGFDAPCGPEARRLLLAYGAMAASRVRDVDQIGSLAEVEFSIFSQWGEDGIIEWLVARNGEMPESFIEFGVEDYRESNTRFLLCNRNWRGLVIDGSEANINVVRQDDISWRYDLTSKAAFIDASNINALIGDAGFEGDVGMLSIDIDGCDYWVWDSISVVNPHIVVAEYNANFGDIIPLTVPYDPKFRRTAAHWSNLYFGASIGAFEELAIRRGYTLLGTNLAGGNAFFIRNDRLEHFDGRVRTRDPRPSRFREGRDKKGHLNFVRGLDRAEVIAALPVTDVKRGLTRPLGEFGELFSPRWRAIIEGRA
jgi:hypothetical protein